MTPNRVDKTDDKKETGKVSKERVRSGRSDKSSSNAPEKEEKKQGKGRKTSRNEQEKKNETPTRSSGVRRASKTDIKGFYSSFI